MFWCCRHRVCSPEHMAQLFNVREAAPDDAGGLVQLLQEFGHPATEDTLRQRLNALEDEGLLHLGRRRSPR